MIRLLGVLFSLALAHAQPPITIGLNADLSSTNEISGQAIKRGALIAIAEINAQGGLLGRELVLDSRDHRRNPARGIAHLQAFGADEHLVAVLGGKHTPVVLAELETIHALKIPYLIPWAAGTPLIDHAYRPSYTFRLSVRDAQAGGFLVDRAFERGFERIGLLLEQTAWGRSNEVAISAALRQRGIEPVWVEWFVWSQRSFDVALERLQRANAQAILFVGNSPEGAIVAQALLGQPADQRLPVLSHWGIVGGEFEAVMAGRIDELDWEVLQTFSFFNPPYRKRALSVMAAYDQLFGPIDGAAGIPAAVGTAHAYDLVHLLARAITLAGTTDRAAVRDALERIDRHEGLIRVYEPPFSATRHEALDRSDYQMMRFKENLLVPIRPIL